MLLLQLPGNVNGIPVIIKPVFMINFKVLYQLIASRSGQFFLHHSDQGSAQKVLPAGIYLFILCRRLIEDQRQGFQCVSHVIVTPAQPYFYEQSNAAAEAVNGILLDDRSENALLPLPQVQLRSAPCHGKTSMVRTAQRDVQIILDAFLYFFSKGVSNVGLQSHFNTMCHIVSLFCSQCLQQGILL